MSRVTRVSFAPVLRSPADNCRCEIVVVISEWIKCILGIYTHSHLILVGLRVRKSHLDDDDDGVYHRIVLRISVVESALQRFVYIPVGVH